MASPGDEAAFLDAADRFLNDEDLRRRAGLQSRKYAEEQFKIDAIADQFEAVVQVAADARRSVVHKQHALLGRWRLKPAISS